ncbi:hypothetical protein EG829_26765 [bacterium]|nr:hypothetical protein [bacterium]
MSRAFIATMLAVVLMLAGCAASSRMASGKEQTAIEQTLRQARADLNCTQLTPNVISKKMNMTPVPEAQFTIGVTGCGKSAMYTAICQEYGEDYKECIISQAPGGP